MARKTSIDTYRKIRDNGLLSKRRWEVYDALYLYGPKTANELFRSMRDKAYILNSNTRTRLSELRDLGVVDEITEEHVCSVTGETVILWDTNDNEPRKGEKLIKQPTKRELIEALCQGIERVSTHFRSHANPREDYMAWVNNMDRLLELCVKHRKKKK